MTSWFVVVVGERGHYVAEGARGQGGEASE